MVEHTALWVQRELGATSQPDTRQRVSLPHYSCAPTRHMPQRMPLGGDLRNKRSMAVKPHKANAVSFWEDGEQGGPMSLYAD